MGNTGLYLEAEGNFSSDIGEEIWEEREGKTRRRFDSDCVISLIKLLIARFSPHPPISPYGCVSLQPWIFNGVELADPLKSLAYYDWSNYFIVSQTLRVFKNNSEFLFKYMCVYIYVK